MMTTTHPLAAAWLDRIDRLATGLPEERRQELLADLRDHLDTALGGDTDTPQVEAVLARMGDPADIVAEARDDLPPAPPVLTARIPAEQGHRLNTAEVVTLVLFVLSGLMLVLWPLAIIAWVVATVLLATRDRWVGKENLVALLLPFGFSVPWVVLGTASISAPECVTSASQDAAGTLTEITNCGASGPGIVGITAAVALAAAFFAAIWGVVWLVRRIHVRHAMA